MSASLSDDGPLLTRSKLLSKSKALAAARSIASSHLGSAVIRNRTHETNVYQLELRRLERETALRLRQLERSRSAFVATRCRSLQPEPSTILGDETRRYRTTRASAGGGQRRRIPADDDFEERGGYHPTKPTVRSVHSAPVKQTIYAFRSPTTHV